MSWFAVRYTAGWISRGKGQGEQGGTGEAGGAEGTGEAGGAEGVIGSRNTAEGIMGSMGSRGSRGSRRIKRSRGSRMIRRSMRSMGSRRNRSLPRLFSFSCLNRDIYLNTYSNTST